MSISAKVHARLQGNLKRFQPVLTAAKARDVNEADTVTIVKDMLAELFGYDKYTEVTSEYAIRGTYVDLAIKIDGKLHLLVEVKAVGQELDERHTKQAVDYGANQGVEWVALTNGTEWRVYRITFSKPIGQELVMTTDLLALNHRSREDVEALFPLTKEGIAKSALHDHHEQRQATNKFVLGAILQSEAVVDVIRREIRRLNPNVRIEEEEVRRILISEVIKREIVEDEKAKEAHAKVRRSANRRLRIIEKENQQAPVDVLPSG